ncbi:hypothetical protein LOK49_LG13G01135 [Camellia lanceoleosa]|uniref:Uncharacterized protein n=1 Tax=Camellia lanceoleosa TaxID=1840588 RepID=A0ACC0FFP9_9ERIC|nr:hypothetical protein LOK49_LG13G01135 [Camellia lanceoleosa]
MKLNRKLSQSRADLPTLGLAVTNILTGLVWLSIRPKTILVVNPKGMECQRIKSHLPEFVVFELLWAWESLLVATIYRSSVIVYDGEFIFQIGFVAASPASDREAVPVDANNLMQESYLDNLSLYPRKSELPFLPSNTQIIMFLILRPLEDKGIAIIGGDTIRGFTTSDEVLPS